MKEQVRRPDHNLLLAIVFLLLYVPFVVQYGYNWLHKRAIDYPSFYYAADLVYRHHTSPYAPAADMAAVEAEYGAPVYVYSYPPPDLLPLAPLSLVSYRAGRMAMLAGNHILVLFCLLLFTGGILRFRREQALALFAVVYVLSYWPIVSTIQHAQLNLIVLALVGIGWYALKRDWGPFWVALPLSVAVLVKTYPALFIIYLLLRRQYRAAAWATGLVAAFVGVAVLVLPHSVWGDWLHYVLADGSYGDKLAGFFSPASPYNLGINGFTSRLFVPNEFCTALLPSHFAGRVVPYLLTFAVIAVTILASGVLSHKPADFRSSLDIEMALVLVVQFLLAPMAWEHHLVYVLPAALLSVSLAIQPGERPLWRVAVALAVLAIALPFPREAPQLTVGLATLAISLRTFAVLALWANLLHKARARRFCPAAQTS